MCNFFSLCSNGKGKIFYFNAKQRKRLKNSSYKMDSHTSIADYYGYKGAKEDVLNKWEYNPLTKKLTADQINTADDTEIVKRFCDNLDFQTIVPELIIKPIINPKLVRKHKVTKKDIGNFKKWISVRGSVGGSFGSSVMDSLEGSFKGPVIDSVWFSVMESFRGYVGIPVWAYISSFFNIKYKYDYSPCVKLWERGFVPSFDGKVWRLHQGENMDIVFETFKGEI